MSFARYKKYKCSGVEWLGDVPAHWDVVAIKWLSPVKRGASPRPIEDPKYFDEEGEFAWVRITDVSASDGVIRESTQRLSELGSSLSVKIAPGELFVSIAGSVGKPCISAIKACIHDGFVHFPTLGIDPRFLYRIFEAGLCYGGLGKWGTQLNLNTDTIGSIRVAIPPLPELEGLLKFLDRETAKIDDLIAEQERLIELLQEKRQAVISHAVTKGLNPDVPVSPSGMEWLGDVPAHWLTCRIKNLVIDQCGVQIGPFGGMLRDLETHDTGFKVVGQENVISRDLARGSRWVRESRFHELAGYRVEKHDLLLTRKGSLGNAFLIDCDLAPTIIDSDTIRVRLDESRCLPRFAEILLHEAPYVASQIDFNRRGAILSGLNSETVSQLYVTVPPVGEQLEIVEVLRQHVLRFNELTMAIRLEIGLLRERRSALICAAVTGQIDVRNAVEQEVV